MSKIERRIDLMKNRMRNREWGKKKVKRERQKREEREGKRE